MPSFESEYARLNPSQKQAVDYIEGPLLVIAGPGTGKTQLLSIRAANILAKTDALAENILCLTFTESGASEMRRRLISIIGEDAYRITISTYHAFGNEVINQNLSSIDALRADIIIRDIQKKLKYSSDFKDEYSVKNIRALISDAKKATLTPKDILKIAETNLDFIKNASQVTKPLTESVSRVSLKSLASFEKLRMTENKVTLPVGVEPLATLWNNELSAAIENCSQTKKTSALTIWKAKFLEKDDSNLFIAKGQKQNQKLVEFSDIYTHYQDRLDKDGLIDYDDMILKANEALRSRDDLRFNLQEKYLYIMLDEYQDTNKAQAELVELLTSSPVYEGRPNVMAVGDDDQAIYAFQGAKHSNMIDFANSYDSVKLITLKTNYRSTQDIVDLSSRTAGQIKSRLTSLLEKVSKDFKSYASRSGRISSLSFNNEIDEYAWLAENIKESKENKIAVIAPEHKFLERASAYLLASDIPISYERKENVLDDPKINQIISIIRLLLAINEHNDQLSDVLLAKILNFELFELPTELIWQLSWQSYEQRVPWLKLMLKNPKLRELALMFLKLAANSLNYRYDFIIDQVIGLSDIVINGPNKKSTRLPFLEYYTFESDDLVSRLFQNLITLKNKFIEFNGDNSKPLMIVDLVDFVDQLTSSDERLTNDLSYIQSEAKVELMSAHGAKGQEFDCVYLLSFVNETWGPKTSKNSLSLPLNLEYVRQKADDPDDEKLRLLYVALSRAKTRLITLSYDEDYEAKETGPLRYLDLKPTQVKLDFQPDLIPLWQQDNRQVEIPTDLRATLLKRIEGYALNATDLKTFIDVSRAGPKDFYESAMLRYKTYTTTHMDYGSAVHSALDWLQKALSESSKVPALKKVIEQYESNLNKRRLIDHDYIRLREQGIDALSAFYELNKGDLSKDDLSEYSFRSEGETVNGHRITGQVDKLVINKDSRILSIIDYKTGKGDTSFTKGAKLYLYRYQLYFYKLLVEKSSAFKNYNISGARLDFIQPNLNDARKFRLQLDFDKQLEDRLIKLIDAIWKHINELNFPDVSHYKQNIKGIKQFEDDLIDGRI